MRLSIEALGITGALLWGGVIIVCGNANLAGGSYSARYALVDGGLAEGLIFWMALQLDRETVGLTPNSVKEQVCIQQVRQFFVGST
jgi:hypothetical protein